jgi:hypothetical protein
MSEVRLQILAGCDTQQSGTKRRKPRYSIRGEFTGSELPAFQARKKPAVFRGRVKDISDGGFCVLAARRPEQSVLLQGLLRLAQMPAQIPTFVQVRWVKRQLGGRHYRIGLQYVI